MKVLVVSASPFFMRIMRSSSVWHSAGVPWMIIIIVNTPLITLWSSLVSQWNAGDMGSIPGWGRSPGEGNGNLLQYCCWGNPMDRGAWLAIVHGVAKEFNTI